MANLILILGDQLSTELSALRGIDDKARDTILMAEVMEEATYVKHHKKKIAFLFSAMRHFAQQLRDEGYKLIYTKLDDKDNAGSLFKEVTRHAADHDAIILTEPGEYRLLEDMKNWHPKLGRTVDIRPDDRFIASHDDFTQWAEGRKTLTMEYFYREMRKKTDLLMTQDNQPKQGQWNYDHDNRKALPKNNIPMPGPKKFTPDAMTQEVIALVEKNFLTILARSMTSGSPPRATKPTKRLSILSSTPSPITATIKMR